jgi:hypothetical protein
VHANWKPSIQPFHNFGSVSPFVRSLPEGRRNVVVT